MDSPTNLLDLLRAAATEAPDQMIVHVQSDGSEVTRTYRTLHNEAERVNSSLRRAGLRQGTPVILILDRSEEFLPAFWGALFAGLVPVPLGNELEKVFGVWTFLDQPPVVTDATLAARLPALSTRKGLPTIPRVLILGDLLSAEPGQHFCEPAPSDLAEAWS
jgi:acyl-CoA synthetase (AMP-forming)/AMP-acid ligase II